MSAGHNELDSGTGWINPNLPVRPTAPDRPTPTPRTDRAQAKQWPMNGGAVSADFARTLERELSKEKQSSALYERLYAECVDAVLWMHDDKTITGVIPLGSNLTTVGVAELKKQRDSLRRSLAAAEDRVRQVEGMVSVPRELLKRLANTALVLSDERECGAPHPQEAEPESAKLYQLLHQDAMALLSTAPLPDKPEGTKAT